MKVPVKLLYGVVLGCLLMTVVGFVQWLRLQLRLGMVYQAAKAGVPYQNINLKAADVVNRISNEWLAAAFAGLLISGLLLTFSLKLKAPDAAARNFWRG